MTGVGPDAAGYGFRGTARRLRRRCDRIYLIDVIDNLKSTEHNLSKVFSSNFDIVAAGFPARINGARAGFMEAFMLAGLPSSRDERFLQNDMRALFGAEERDVYFGARPLSSRTPAFGEIPGMKAVVFENGAESLSRNFRTDGIGVDMDETRERPETETEAGDGIGTKIDAGSRAETTTKAGQAFFCGSLKRAFADLGDDLLVAYNSITDNGEDALTALNSAFMQDVALVWVPSGAKLQEPLFLDFRYLSENEALICLSRTLIVLGEGAEADISILYRSADADDGGEGHGKARFLINHVSEIVVGRDARLRLSEAALPGKGSAILMNNYMRQAARSGSKSVFVSVGEGDVRFSLRTDLAGEGAEADLHGLYLSSDAGTGKTGTLSDVELRLSHLEPDCRSRQLVKGIAAGRSTGVFSGMVYVAKGAQRTDAAQQNRNLQIDDEASVFTRPQLEIYADDVKCGHGATVGRLDEEAVYYMRQRGVGESEARRMQMQGFADDIINHCSSDSFREFIAAKAGDKINNF